MKQDFKEDFEKLIKQAYDAGYLYAAWSDGAHVSNENYNKSEDDLSLAVQHFLEKYNE
jgi:peptidase E